MEDKLRKVEVGHFTHFGKEWIDDYATAAIELAREGYVFDCRWIEKVKLYIVKRER